MKKLNTDPATNTQANQEQPSKSGILDMPETSRKMQATSLNVTKKAIQVELVKTKGTGLSFTTHAMNHMQ